MCFCPNAFPPGGYWDLGHCNNGTACVRASVRTESGSGSTTGQGSAKLSPKHSHCESDATTYDL